MSPDKSESLDNESGKFGSESRYSGTYSFRGFPLRSEESIDGVFPPEVFSPTGSEYKGGRLVSIFLRLL